MTGLITSPDFLRNAGGNRAAKWTRMSAHRHFPVCPLGGCPPSCASHSATGSGGGGEERNCSHGSEGLVKLLCRKVSHDRLDREAAFGVHPASDIQPDRHRKGISVPLTGRRSYPRADDAPHELRDEHGRVRIAFDESGPRLGAVDLRGVKVSQSMVSRRFGQEVARETERT